MFRSILVPLDASLDSADALPIARIVAKASGGTIHLLTVRPPTSEKAASDAWLADYAAELRSNGIEVDVSTTSGDVVASIVRYAQSRAVDLLVMATRAVGPRSILALTSVARQMLTVSPCPVLLVRPGDRQPDQIANLLVPLDGSPGGSLALAAARALASAAESRLVLLQVVVPVTAEAVAALPGLTVGGYIDPEWEEIACAAARGYVNGVAQRLRAGGVRCEARVAVGDVATEILRTAAEMDADLIVMSTHAAPWSTRAYIGSVAECVLRNGSRPVLAVRRESPAGESARDW